MTEGHVYSDGLRTDMLNLDALRSSITIIPQVVSVSTRVTAVVFLTFVCSLSF